MLHVPKSISPSQRVREFPNEAFSVSTGKLFRNACREELGLKTTVIHPHIQSKRHTSGKECLKQRKVEDLDIAEAFKSMKENT